MNIPVDEMTRRLQTDEQFREYIRGKFPDELSWWDRFAERNGPQCGFARSAVRRMYTLDPRGIVEALGRSPGGA